MDYQQHYQLQEALSTEEGLVPPPRLFDYDETQIYAAIMDLLAQDQANGVPSPFRSKQPGSAHSILVGGITELISFFGYEMDKVPDRAWVHILRLLGAKTPVIESPVLSLSFEKSETAVLNSLDAIVPIGTVVSDIFGNFTLTTLYSITIPGSESTGIVQARLDSEVLPADYTQGMFSLLKSATPYVTGVQDVGITSTGQTAQNLSEIAQIVRGGVRTGNLGRYQDISLIDTSGENFLGRCVTFADYIYYAKRLGAEKANAFRGVQLDNVGFFGDLTTVVVYPGTAVSGVDVEIRKIAMEGIRLDIVPATIVPLDGIITVKVAASIRDSSVRDLVAEAIVSSINPPAGIWGDPQFLSNLATAIESVQGIYAVSRIELKHALTNVPFTSLKIEAWHLLEIQNTIEIEVSR
jgi:hypothetical protein